MNPCCQQNTTGCDQFTNITQGKHPFITWLIGILDTCCHKCSALLKIKDGSSGNSQEDAKSSNNWKLLLIAPPEPHHRHTVSFLRNQFSVSCSTLLVLVTMFGVRTRQVTWCLQLIQQAHGGVDFYTNIKIHIIIHQKWSFTIWQIVAHLIEVLVQPSLCSIILWIRQYVGEAIQIFYICKECLQIILLTLCDSQDFNSLS